MTHSLTHFIDPAVTIAIAGMAAVLALAEQRARRAQFYAAVLERVMVLLDATPAETASLLGASRQSLEHWVRKGVPAPWQSQLARFYQTVLALRQRLTPVATRQLLAVQQRCHAERVRALSVAGSPTRATGPRGVIITVR